MEAQYNWLLVGLSYVVSVLGAFTALQLAVAIPNAGNERDKARAIMFSAMAMGGGAIWAMHFIAMLAFEMNIPVRYDVLLTLLSALVGTMSCAVGLTIAGSGVFSFFRLLPAGLFMGCGVAGMHYMGMAAMLMPAEVSYDFGLLLISVIIAVIASCVALWMAFHMRGSGQILGSAVVAGVAVCGMHYTGMAAARYQMTEIVPNPLWFGAMGGDYLGLGIFVVAVCLLSISLIISHGRQRQRESLQI